MINVSAYKEYNKKTVLDVRDVSFARNNIYAIIGSNGSGKSTLLKCVASLIKFNGKIECDGLKLKSVGYLPQKNYAFDMSVKNNMLLSRKIKYRKDALADALVMLKKFDLVQYVNKNASRLSGGETQKLAICRLFMGDYKLVLLDEPTASLDINSTLTAEEMIRDYQSSHRSTMIIATHSLRQAKAISDYVVYIEKGIIEEITPTTEFFKEPQTEKAKAFLSFHTDF